MHITVLLPKYFKISKTNAHIRKKNHTHKYSILCTKAVFYNSFNIHNCLEQHPRSHHEGNTTASKFILLRTCCKVGFELATNSIQFYDFAN